MAPLISKKAQIAMKVEGAEGTAEALTATEAILVNNVVFDPSIEMHPRPAGGASLSPYPDVAGARSARITFDLELKGAGAPAGVAPEAGAALKACGFSETIVASTSVTYKPASASIGSYTIGAYFDGKLYLMAGCRGNVSLEFARAGAPGVFHFDFLGTAMVDSDTAMLAPTFDSTVPIACQGATFTLSSYAAIVESMTFAMNNELFLRPSVNATQGNLSTAITGRRPTLSINPEDVLLATKDWWALWEAGTTGALSMVLGAAAGNICTITAPAVQFSSMKPVNANGILRQNAECLLARSSGDDELSLAFT
ncbi:MAG: phage tail tube protein [Spirochaetota bacterium]